MTFKELNFVKLRNYYITFNWTKGYIVFLNFTYQSTLFWHQFLVSVYVTFRFEVFIWLSKNFGWMLTKKSSLYTRLFSLFWRSSLHNSYIHPFFYFALFLLFLVSIFIISLWLIKLLSQTKPLLFIIRFSILDFKFLDNKKLSIIYHYHLSSNFRKRLNHVIRVFISFIQHMFYLKIC